MAVRLGRITDRAHAAGDQSRVATPAEAARAGADYVVLGRSVTAAADPAAALARAVEELRGG